MILQNGDRYIFRSYVTIGFMFFFMAYLLFVSGISDDNRIQTESSFSTSIISQEDILTLVCRWL